MLLVDLYCQKCKTYSFFRETETVEAAVPLISMMGIYIENITVNVEIMRCLLCGCVAEPIADFRTWDWLYWYAWWNGEEPDGASYLEG